ncbi:hypothetical protein HRbin17_00574 [bacterium HR17]|uniref:Alpha-galactosidase NEW3 domain-containing protein n=1 Tax=Candidatus Fervidibacter japonicus TaxID=2035412 RepID=A0A2H5XA69_9BACT|nr:hypothetical protein HRbin17_00574 [bacterium HR17]
MGRGAIVLTLLMVGSNAIWAQLANGSFEELGAYQFPVGWVWFASDRDAAIVRVTTDAADGRFALYMEARKPVTVGVNRTYKAGKEGEVVPDIGAMLPIKKGALVFRFKVLKATTDNVRVYAIPMKTDNLEGGATRFAYIVPHQFAGDGKWHTGVLAFDFSDKPEVRAVQIGLRINEGGQPAPAAVIFDDFRYAERAGWHLRLRDVRIEEGLRAGEHGYLAVQLENTGDIPAPVTAQLQAPKGFEVKPSDIPQSVAPNGTATLWWSVRGVRRNGTKFVVQWRVHPQVDERVEHVCVAQLRLTSFGFANALLFAGQPHTLRLVLRNDGDAVADSVQVALTLNGLTLQSGAGRQKLPVVPPGERQLVWQVRPQRPQVVDATVRLTSRQMATTAVARAIVSQPINDRDRQTLTVTTERLRLLLPRNPFGYGVFAVEVHDGTAWRRMALSPQLLLVGYQTLRRQGVMRSIFADKAQRLDNGGLVFPFRWADPFDNGQWQGEVRFEPDGVGIKVVWRLQADRPQYLLGVHGPTLFVGDHAFGTRKDMALLPGVYWLLADERVDDARYSDPPHHLHIVPHPYKLTQPLMVIAHDGVFVGLMWDALQGWMDGEGQGAETGLCPQPIFVVPNTVAAQDNHLLGLMVPNVPKWIKENALWGQTPLRLGANNPLQMTAWIIGGKGGILDAYDAYFAKFPLPPVPQRPYDDAETFRRSKHGMRSERYGKLLAWLQVLERSAIDDAKTQRADGSWGFALDRGWTLEMLRKFAPHRSLDEYGKEGDTTVGTCTFQLRRAVALLRYARVTGSTRAAELGLKAIRFIDATFVRPEGAQTWEVPLHCPDVLAAANAVHAYLEAWRLTGDAYWLRRAVDWAKTGLPFIYLWNPPDRPTMMRYASIPVFGTSFFAAAPWFGTPVQWNGLDYAYALLNLSAALRLSPIAPSQSPDFWRHIAEGITVCAIQQQAAVNHPNGNYPDSVALTYRYAPNDKGILDPFGIVRNLWLLRNEHDDAGDYATVAVNTQPPIRVTSDGIVERAEWHDGTLNLGLRAPEGVTETQTVVAGVTAPRQVFADEHPVAFRYDARRKWVVLTLRHAKPTVTVRVVGVTPTVYERLGVVWERPVWEFNTDSDPDDWTPIHDLAPFEVANGILHTRSVGADPYMHSPPIRVAATQSRTLVLRLRVQVPLNAQPIGQVFWTRDDDPQWSESKSVKFPLPIDGQWHELRVDLSGSPEWRGTITQLRLDPGSGAGIVVELDFVRLE